MAVYYFGERNVLTLDFQEFRKGVFWRGKADRIQVKAYFAQHHKGHAKTNRVTLEQQTQR